MKYSPEQRDVLTRIASNVGQITFLSKALRRPEADKALLRSRRRFCARYLLEAAEEALGMGFKVRRMDEYRQWAAGNYPWGQITDDDCGNPEPLLLPLRRARVGRPSGAMTNIYRAVYWLSSDKQASVRLIAEAQKICPQREPACRRHLR